MKKLVTAAVAVMIMAFSLVTAFAATNIDSPVPTTVPETQTSTSVTKPDDDPKSPKTGMNDSLVYAVLAFSVVGVGVASVALVKGSKKN